MEQQILTYRTEIDGGKNVRVEYHDRTYTIPVSQFSKIIALADKEGVKIVWFR